MVFNGEDARGDDVLDVAAHIVDAVSYTHLARDLFALAAENGTPMYSSSALRFSKELAELPDKDVRFVLLSGPGKPENYLIHQIEPMVALLRARAVRVLYAGVELSLIHI